MERGSAVDLAVLRHYGNVRDGRLRHGGNVGYVTEAPDSQVVAAKVPERSKEDSD